ncbi:eukaryotic translation initiation factor 4 gamma 3-like isoform X3 [Paramuricea clavata]|uniref:Eukaryotic translation initiation factor 4 gamma 3-like isoform X3 n=1 Tax=Paramuricea clavata TaxID=317549 RepID=A0A6S7JR48_PARCT|nr:eukaryotic translation initiation factor 4 gamma 3-like isoform X3 [Paramuricea clavata]
MYEALAKNKKRVLGNIRFIGELFKLKLLTENIMHDCIFKLLRAGDEESLECICTLLFTIGKDLDSHRGESRIEQYFDQINRIIIAKKISLRVIFKLRDVVELRQNKWVPRREEDCTPKTIHQIHKEAQMANVQKQRSAAHRPPNDNKKKEGRPGWRSHSKPTSSDRWITTGESGKNLNFLPDENNDKLLQLLCADPFKNDSVFAYIERHFKEEERKEAEFISQLVTAVAESCVINKDREVGPDFCQDKLKARKDILRKYLDNDNSLELQALFALQEIYVKYNKPADMLSRFFNTLYDEEVITEEAFMTWKQDENPLRQEGKASALQATASLFEWLQSAAVESSEN